ncbi:unnamed protein product [Spirodela intermedia]|uniref:Uncharacterized protein n=1 Tax=Spirodela intermedia TaxID=51605 RepID=A0A7I8IW73_SPIIN|nr:unnamed protein product [Spirodela intermedia]CAA6662119.1 unnamed protein product [Spirodela intermedia]
MRLRDLVPSAANSVNTTFILLEKGHISSSKRKTGNKLQESRECLALVADESAAAFEPGDILRLTSGIFSFHRHKLVLRSGRKGRVEKVGEFTMLFVESPNMSDAALWTAAKKRRQEEPLGEGQLL